MSTTPVPVTATAISPTSPLIVTTAASVGFLAAEIAWVKAHEKLLILVLAAFLLYRTGQGIENVILKRESIIANQAAVTVKSDDAANTAGQKLLDQMKTAADAQTKTLNDLITKSKAAYTDQIKKDASATPSQIDARWQQLLPMKPGAVKSIDQETTGISNDAANQTVQALEQIPVLQTQVISLTTELDADQKVIIQQDGVIVGLNKEIVDEKAQDVADVKLEKAKSKHSFWKGFKYGVVIGVVGTEAIRIWAGRP